MTFTTEGELIYSTLEMNVVTSRILLTYRVDGDSIVTDQPSAPNEQRTRIVQTEKGLLVGKPPILLQSDRHFRSDPLAPAMALGLAALERTLGASAPAGIFRPFLLVQLPSERRTTHFLGDDADARAAALREFAKVRNTAVAAAWTYADRLALSDGESDAVVAEVSCVQALRGVALIQPFAFSSLKAARAGALVPVDRESWFAAPA